jgi:hypothetical protein
VAAPGTKHPLYLEARNLIGTPDHIKALAQTNKKAKKKKNKKQQLDKSFRTATLVKATLKNSEADI